MATGREQWGDMEAAWKERGDSYKAKFWAAAETDHSMA